jgi:hypothetical protein
MSRRRLTTIVFVAVVAILAACGGSRTADLAHFNGIWVGTTTYTSVCDGGPSSTSVIPTDSMTFVLTATGLKLESAPCPCDLTVSGDTATCANEPVTCSAGALAIDGGFTLLLTRVVTRYAATTSDGHTLTVTAAGTSSAVSPGQMACTFTETFAAMR